LGGPTVTEFRGPHGMEEGKGERYLAPGRQYGNALLGVRHQEEEDLLQAGNENELLIIDSTCCAVFVAVIPVLDSVTNVKDKHV